MAVGASAAQVGTANFLEPMAMPIILSDLRKFCEAHGFANVADLIGRTLHFDAARAKVA
jgi:dihydroorotate dehydrogenase (NAD+) catalytic subunit